MAAGYLARPFKGCWNWSARTLCGIEAGTGGVVWPECFEMTPCGLLRNAVPRKSLMQKAQHVHESRVSQLIVFCRWQLRRFHQPMSQTTLKPTTTAPASSSDRAILFQASRIDCSVLREARLCQQRAWPLVHDTDITG